MRKGIIMEVDNHFVTLLTPEGEFLKSKKTYREQPYMIGEEITFSPVLKNKVNKWSHFSGTKTLIAGMVACMILFFSLFPAFNKDEAYAYMTIEVNPGVEMALDKNLHVIKLRALNKEGKSIVEGIKDWEDKSATTVSHLILNSMKDNGFLKNPDQVILSTVGLKDKEKKQQLVQSVQKSLPVKSEVTVVEATKKERKIAKKQGVATGQYVKSKAVEKSKPEIKKEPQTKPASSSTKTEEKNIPVKQSSIVKQKNAEKKEKPVQHPGKPATITHPRSNDSHKKNVPNNNERPKSNGVRVNEKQDKSKFNHSNKVKENRENDVKKNSHMNPHGNKETNSHGDRRSDHKRNYHNKNKQSKNNDPDKENHDSGREKKKDNNRD
ncbi:anti-sigma factor domain-containing protein [Peribacillus acanthi]|uniref:anti-sigma factor domain-containing protein n=1 Tax=Peribacillus acanthi TaxID=2171554 RepID=UPI0013008178|nr:anti-sigma factor domain-containing protein [Peribacillus acanthi]